MSNEQGWNGMTKGDNIYIVGDEIIKWCNEDFSTKNSQESLEMTNLVDNRNQQENDPYQKHIW